MRNSPRRAGRPDVYTPAQIDHVRKILSVDPDTLGDDIAKETGVKPWKIREIEKEMKNPTVTHEMAEDDAA